MYFISFIFYDRGSPFPGLNAVLPVMGAALIVWSGINSSEKNQSPLVLRVLAIRPLVLIGLVSYSLYLWHWPLLALNEYMVVGRDSLLVKLIIILVSLLLAIISWKFIEQPVRKKKVAASRSLIFSICVGGMTIF